MDSFPSVNMGYIKTTDHSSPIRIDFFDEEVESIKFFDPLTQISIESIEDVRILPISEILLNEKNSATK